MHQTFCTSCTLHPCICRIRSDHSAQCGPGDHCTTTCANRQACSANRVTGFYLYVSCSYLIIVYLIAIRPPTTTSGAREISAPFQVSVWTPHASSTKYSIRCFAESSECCEFGRLFAYCSQVVSVYMLQHSH